MPNRGAMPMSRVQYCHRSERAGQ